MGNLFSINRISTCAVIATEVIKFHRVTYFLKQKLKKEIGRNIFVVGKNVVLLHHMTIQPEILINSIKIVGFDRIICR
jgi:hypothetical protein